MILALAASSALLAAPAQTCGSDLPLPSTFLSQIGRTLSATSEFIASTSRFDPQIYLWTRSGSSGVFDTAVVPAAGGDILGTTADGTSMAVLTRISNSLRGLHVWERSASGTWIEGAPLHRGLPPDRFLTGSVAMEGGTLVCRTRGLSSSEPARIAVFDRGPLTGEWKFTEEVSNPGTDAFASFNQLAGGRLFSGTGTFGNQGVYVFERTSGTFTLDATLQGATYTNQFDASGDRVAFPGEDFVDIWRRDPAGWVLEQRLDGPSVEDVRDISLGENTLAVHIYALGFGGPVPAAVSVFRRLDGSQTWLATQGISPPTGFEGTTEEWGETMAMAGDFLAVADDDFGLFGRIATYDLTCLTPPPVLHWTPARLSLEASPTWPALGQQLDVQAPFPFDPGAPYGLRDAELSVVGDYLLDIQGQPCALDYGTNICAHVAFALRDAATGLATSSFPIDPSGGLPQLFQAVPGPQIAASTSQVQIPWPYRFEGSHSVRQDLRPIGTPLQLELAAQMYNCIDFTGIWFPDDPNVQAFGCGLEFLPVSVTSREISATLTGSLAFLLPPLQPDLLGFVCDGGVNDAGFQAELSMVGTSSVADNALYFDVTGLIPGATGILFLSPEAATPPFSPLGFGSLCLAPPFMRVPGSLGVADEFGNAAQRLDLSTLPAGAQPQPGSTWAVQWMYRDGGSVNTTSARTVQFR